MNLPDLYALAFMTNRLLLHTAPSMPISLMILGGKKEDNGGENKEKYNTGGKDIGSLQ